MSADDEDFIASRSQRTGDRSILPMSYAQQHLWLLEQLNLVGPGSHPSAAFGLQGDLDVALLERCFTDIVRRHENLRTRFDVIDGEAVQIIDPPPAVRVASIDLRPVEPALRTQGAMLLERQHRERAFDLARGPLLRAYVLRLDEAEYVLQIVMHQIIADDWSVDVLLRELGALYSAYKQGDPIGLKPLEWQYADYTRWQRQRLQGQMLKRLLSYWGEHLRAAPRAIELPTDRPRDPLRRHRSAVYPFEWSLQMSRTLRQASESQGATVFMLLLGAMQVLLGRWSSQDDVVVGTAVAGRTRPELMGMTGLFANALPLRTNLSGDPSVSELLGRIREATLNAYAHQELPFGKLIAELRPPSAPGRMPVFQVLLTVDEIPRHTFDASGVIVTREFTGFATAHFDLAIRIAQTASGMKGRIEYEADLYDAATIERFTTELEGVLGQMTARPFARLSELRIRGPADDR